MTSPWFLLSIFIDFSFNVFRLWAAINRDSVSHFRFPLRSPTLVITCSMSFVCLLKYPYRCFYSNFCFLDIIRFPVRPDYFILCGFFTPKSEWQQVFSAHPNSFKYSSWSQQCRSLENLNISFNLHIHRPFSCSKNSNFPLHVQ